MAKEDILLREEMGRLEIEPIKLKRSRSEENPFYNFLSHKKRSIKKSCFPCGQCTCSFHKKNVSNGICKRRNGKILKEPVLQILKTCVSTKNERDNFEHDIITSTNVNIDALSLCTLVKNCNQLKISSTDEKCGVKQEDDKTKWWKSEMSSSRENKEQRHSNQTGTCSQQALNPPCDVTIDELASYFETLVHIPKKMSSMAEMMYI